MLFGLYLGCMVILKILNGELSARLLLRDNRLDSPRDARLDAVNVVHGVRFSPTANTEHRPPILIPRVYAIIVEERSRLCVLHLAAPESTHREVCTPDRGSMSASVCTSSRSTAIEEPTARQSLYNVAQAHSHPTKHASSEGPPRTSHQ